MQVVAAVPANAGIKDIMPLKAELQALRQLVADSAERRRQALSALVAEEEQNVRHRRELTLVGVGLTLVVLGFIGWVLRRLVHGILDHNHGDLQDDATTVLVEWRP